MAWVKQRWVRKGEVDWLKYDEPGAYDKPSQADFNELEAYMERARNEITPQKFWAAMYAAQTARSAQDVLNENPETEYATWDAVDGLIEHLIDGEGWTPRNIMNALEEAYPQFAARP